MSKRAALLVAALLAAQPVAALAQGYQLHGAPKSVPASPATKAFIEANAKMHKDMAIEFSDNADVDFVLGMIPHHQGAVDMAKIVQRYGKDMEVKKLATAIVADQEKEIAWMKKWLALPANALAAMAERHDHGGGHPEPETPAGKAFAAANDRMHKDMDIAFSGDADVDFVRGMIPHHQGAIDMARVVLAHGKDAEVRKLAGEIVAAQEKEIAWMQSWLKKRGRH